MQFYLTQKEEKIMNNGGDGSSFDFNDWYEREKVRKDFFEEADREERISLIRSYFDFCGIHPDAGYQFENPPLDPSSWSPILIGWRR